jgi:acetyl-CoA acyltransferase
VEAALIIDAVRTPMGRGRAGGALSDVHPVELLAQTLTALLARQPAVDPADVDDLLVGCVSQTGEQSATPGRMAWLAAGLPVHVPATTIDRKCGSSQQAVHFAAQGIMAGVYDIAIAAGVESMSRVPMGSARGDSDRFGPSVTERFTPGLIPQGVAAELVAARWGITRAAQDEFALLSHRRAAAAADSGAFDREIVAIQTPIGAVDRDESIRRSGSLDKLAALPTPFRSVVYEQRFPEIDWSVTAGNASQITDGASAILIVSERAAARLGLSARARVRSMSVCADDPVMMLTAPIPATRKALAAAGMSIGNVEHIEVNEAFAPVPLAWAKELGADLERVNPRGGAIALGHPLGASGARCMTTMLCALEDNDQSIGLQTICEAGGMANATIIERL